MNNFVYDGSPLMPVIDNQGRFFVLNAEGKALPLTAMDRQWMKAN